MEPTTVNEVAADREIDQSRREALKKFGRYAAVAPTAMLLLEPRESEAGRRRGRRRRHSHY